MTFTSSARNLLKLSLLDDQLFRPIRVENMGEDDGLAVEPFINIKPYHQTRIFPPGQPTIGTLLEGDPGYPAETEREAAKELVMQEMPEYARLVQEARTKTREVDEDMVSEDDYGMVVTPLGTGSAIPSKYRNGESPRPPKTVCTGRTLTRCGSTLAVSSTILEIPDFGNILLDAGEGTLGQMKRRYGTDLWADVLSKTKILHVSHMHADHHIGVRRILEERLKVGHPSGQSVRTLHGG